MRFLSFPTTKPWKLRRSSVTSPLAGLVLLIHRTVFLRGARRRVGSSKHVDSCFQDLFTERTSSPWTQPPVPSTVRYEQLRAPFSVILIRRAVLHIDNSCPECLRLQRGV